MLDMKTTMSRGGSRNEFFIRSNNQKTSVQRINQDCEESFSRLEILTQTFYKMGYFVPASISVEQWCDLIPKSNPDIFPPLRVYIKGNYEAFYTLNILTGALEFYSSSDQKPDYSDESIFVKLCYGGCYE